MRENQNISAILLEKIMTLLGERPRATGQAALRKSDEQRIIEEIVTRINKKADANTGNPSGTVIHVAMDTAPSGYLKANGQAVSRTKYVSLFAAIGTTYGSGDGSTTFNLPDMRGEVVRGWDDGRGVDSGRVIGSNQGHAVEAFGGSITAQTSGNQEGIFGSGSGDFSVSGAQNGFDAVGNAGITRYSTVTFTPSATTDPNETRARNIALLACIKT